MTRRRRSLTTCTSWSLVTRTGWTPTDSCTRTGSTPIHRKRTESSLYKLCQGSPVLYILRQIHCVHVRATWLFYLFFVPYIVLMFTNTRWSNTTNRRSKNVIFGSPNVTWFCTSNFGNLWNTKPPTWWRSLRYLKLNQTSLLVTQDFWVPKYTLQLER